MRAAARRSLMVVRLWPVLLVLSGTVAGAVASMTIYRSDQELSTGTIRLSTDPGHRGALDIYVPLVDWGARFDSVRLPVRLRIEARTVDSRAIGNVASGRVDVEGLRVEARDGVESYIRTLIPITFGAALGIGILVSLALR